MDFDKEQVKVNWFSFKFWKSAVKSMFTNVVEKTQDKNVKKTIQNSIISEQKEKASIKI